MGTKQKTEEVKGIRSFISLLGDLFWNYTPSEESLDKLLKDNGYDEKTIKELTKPLEIEKEIKREASAHNKKINKSKTKTIQKTNSLTKDNSNEQEKNSRKKSIEKEHE